MIFMRHASGSARLGPRAAASSRATRRRRAHAHNATPPETRVPNGELVREATGPGENKLDVAIGTRASSRAPLAVPRVLKKPQVLAPAGGWPQLVAAVENGADAVYLGMDALNARARAENFTTAELQKAVEYCHDRSVSVYVTVNVLVFDSELEDVERRLREIAGAGADAVIVQDIGVARLARAVAPGLRVHASTQCSVVSGDGAEFVRMLGCQRVVLGREMSVQEIARTAAATDIEVEVFVHGALCVSYSGQCFSSEAWGGRSANRGQCAQACRLPYGLLVNGTLKELGDVKYLLSPQDLMAVEHLPELMRAGVSCLKIEGRLKGPEYVALTTQVYRRAVDAAWEQMQLEGEAVLEGQGDWRSEAALEPRTLQALQQVFSRGQDESFGGLTPGFLEGPQHQRLVRGLGTRHRGLCVGRVTDTHASGVTVLASVPLAPGQGLLFDALDPSLPESGGHILSVTPVRGAPRGHAAHHRLPSAERSSAAARGSRAQEREEVEVKVRVKDLDVRQVKPGGLCWRTSDPGLLRGLRGSFERVSEGSRRRVTVRAALSGAVGQPLKLTLQDSEGSCVEVHGHRPIEPAKHSAADEAALRVSLGPHLGPDTPFELEELDTSGLPLADGLFIAAGDVKQARRTAVQQLLELRRTRTAKAVAGGPLLPTLQPPSPSMNGNRSLSRETPPSEAQIQLLCRTPEQVAAACAVPWLQEVVLDFLEVHGLTDAVAAVRAAGKRVTVASPRILKPGEERLYVFLLRLRADALLVRSTGLLHLLLSMGGPGAHPPRDPELVIPQLHGDFSLNASNVLSVRYLLELGLERLTLSHDLDARQLADLIAAVQPGGAVTAHPPPQTPTQGTCNTDAQRGGLSGGAGGPRLEVVVHQHLPVFHTEHCVFCRFLSDGNSYQDCGKPCEANRLHLRDEKGQDHVVLADMGCRNTVFNAQAQSALPAVHRLLEAGCRHFRVELVDEAAAAVPALLERYRACILGDADPAEVVRWLEKVPDSNGRAQGCGMGSLVVRKERNDNLKATAAAARRKERRHS